MFGRKFGFKGPFMIEKIPHAIGNQILPLKCSFGIGYGWYSRAIPICKYEADCVLSMVAYSLRFVCFLHIYQGPTIERKAEGLNFQYTYLQLLLNNI